MGLMKENRTVFHELSDNQRRVYTDTAQLYQAYLDACAKGRSFAGGMHWKTVKGREYLFKTLGGKGTGKSLGPRSVETEKIYSQFRGGKEDIERRLASLRERIAEQARFCKAALIQRVPRLVAAILRVLDQKELLGRNVIIIGTNVLYAYEAAAGVSFDTPLVATRDADLLFDPRSELTILVEEESPGAGLLGLLRKVDRSFELMSGHSFRAVNREGYMVDFIKPVPNPPWKKEESRIGGEGDLVAVGIRKLEWIASSRKHSQIVIGEDGFPARMVVPDPRAFALHKLWLSEQEDRDPVKKPRDRAQAEAVLLLVRKYLRQYPLRGPELKMFPMELLERVEDIADEDFPPGFCP